MRMGAGGERGRQGTGDGNVIDETAPPPQQRAVFDALHALPESPHFVPHVTMGRPLPTSPWPASEPAIQPRRVHAASESFSAMTLLRARTPALGGRLRAAHGEGGVAGAAIPGQGRRW